MWHAQRGAGDRVGACRLCCPLPRSVCLCLFRHARVCTAGSSEGGGDARPLAARLRRSREGAGETGRRRRRPAPARGGAAPPADARGDAARVLDAARAGGTDSGGAAGARGQRSAEGGGGGVGDAAQGRSGRGQSCAPAGPRTRGATVAAHPAAAGCRRLFIQQVSGAEAHPPFWACSGGRSTSCS